MTNRSHIDRIMGGAVLLLLCGGAVFMAQQILAPAEAVGLFRQTREAFAEQDYSEADRLSEQLIEVSPDAPAAILLRGQILARINRDAESSQLFEAVSQMQEPYATEAHLGLANHYYRTSHFPLAEKYYRLYLNHRPYDVKANMNLSYLLSLQGRSWSAVPFARQRIELGDFNAWELTLTGLAESHWSTDENILHLCQRRHPGHVLNRFGEVRQAYRDNRLSDEMPLLTSIVREYPHISSPQAMLGTYYLESGQQDEFQQWHARLPEIANEHPEIWYVRGLWQKRTGSYESAASCFLYTFSLSSQHQKALSQLSNVLRIIRPNKELPSFINTVRATSDLAYLIETVGREINTLNIRKVVDSLGTAERYWEAIAWCRMMIRHAPSETWPRDLYEKYYPLAMSQPINSSERLARNWSHFFQIDFPQNPFILSRLSQQTEESSSQIAGRLDLVRFGDDALRSGLDFEYFNGTTRKEGLDHFLHALGGAVVVLDYDLDQWPDLYFCQAGKWSRENPNLVEEKTNPYQDRLFRNMGNGTFTDVTAASGLGDRLFSQGGTAGDFDNDGDPDLLVTNVGRNRFYSNNGDGTFTEISDEFPESFFSREWSTSAAFTDLDQDGNLDLYIMNYVDFEQIREKLCFAEGFERGCYPTLFDSCQDRVYWNDGSGSWKDQTSEWGFLQKDGKGLGLISADFDANGDAELFVGNDTVANSFFITEGDASSDLHRFADRGIPSGLGLNAEGIAQASMGIASGDLNRDGLLDLFVTNFANDSNTLYLQESPMLFVEATRDWNLRDGSYQYLGFGTQFLDVDLDGDLDLVLTNGHIDRERVTHIPEAMPPQFYLNLGDQFAELPSETLGDYFTGRYLGRSLALLDWNRDGLQDVVITHLNAPVALLTNQTQKQGRSLLLQLIGTHSNRDAIGARVRVEQTGYIQYFFRVGGDGYFSRNDSNIHIGLPNVEEPAMLTIDWPAGSKQQVLIPASSTRITLIEQ